MVNFGFVIGQKALNELLRNTNSIDWPLDSGQHFWRLFINKRHNRFDTPFMDEVILLECEKILGQSWRKLQIFNTIKWFFCTNEWNWNVAVGITMKLCHFSCQTSIQTVEVINFQLAADFLLLTKEWKVEMDFFSEEILLIMDIQRIYLL